MHVIRMRAGPDESWAVVIELQVSHKKQVWQTDILFLLIIFYYIFIFYVQFYILII